MFRAPAANSTEVFDELHQLVAADRSDAGLDEVLLIRAKRSAEKLLNANRAAGHIALSAIAALSWDTASAEEHVRSACLYERSGVTLFNAITTLEFINRSDLARPYAIAGGRAAYADAEYATHAIMSLISGGFIREAAELQSDYDSSGNQEPLPMDAKALADALAHINVTEEHVQAVLRLAHDVLSAERCRAREIGIFHEADPDGGRSVSIELGFFGTLDDEFRFDEILSDKLGDLSEWNPIKFTVNYRYVKREDAHTAE